MLEIKKQAPDRDSDGSPIVAIIYCSLYDLQNDKIQISHEHQEYQDGNDPPDASHIRELIGKPESPRGAAPVEEEIGVMHPTGKLPSVNISDPGIYRIQERRDANPEHPLLGDHAVYSGDKEIYNGNNRYDHMP